MDQSSHFTAAVDYARLLAAKTLGRGALSEQIEAAGDLKKESSSLVFAFFIMLPFIGYVLQYFGMINFSPFWLILPLPIFVFRTMYLRLQRRKLRDHQVKIHLASGKDAR